MGMTGSNTGLKEMQESEYKETCGHFKPYQGLTFGEQARDEAHS